MSYEMERLIIKELHEQAISISPEEQRALAVKMKTALESDNQEEVKLYRDTLLKSVLALVAKIANKYANKGTDIGDLIQEGCLGAVKAIDLYDTEKDTSLGTYAYIWIKSFVLKLLLRNRSMVSISDQTLNRMVSVVKAETEYEQETGYSGDKASDEEIASRTGLSLDIVKEVRGFKKLAITTDIGGVLSPRFEDDRKDDGEHLGWLEDKEAEGYEATDRSTSAMQEMLIEERREILIDTLRKTLSENHYNFAKMRWGLNDDGSIGEGLSLAEIGRRLGFSRERARVIESKILKRIRGVSAIQEWGKYFKEQYE